MPRQFDPRKRAAEQRALWDERIPENRVAWVQVHNGAWAIDAIPQPEDSAELSPGIVLGIPSSRFVSNINYSLAHLTEDELLAVKHLIDLAFDLALPVVQYRDKKARDAENTLGGDAWHRNYRQVPQLVIREGKIFQYSEGVWSRPEDVPPGTGTGGGQSGGVRGVGDELADKVPSDSEASNDEPQAD